MEFMSTTTKDVAAFILFEALTAYITAHAWLQAAASGNSAMQTQVIFYTILLSLNWIALILIFMHYKDTRNLVNYVENLSGKDGITILLAIIGVFVFAAIISRPWTTTAIYVPTFAQIDLDFVHFDFTIFIMTVLTNFALVANSEETTKLIGHNALYLYLSSRYPEYDKYDKWASVLAPVTFWSTLHAYVAYVGPLVWQLVLAAWVAGLIIFAVLWKTQSLLAAVTVHGTYNVIVITATGMGWLMLTPGALTFYIGYAVFNLALVLLTWKKKPICLMRRKKL
jgi:hypothetical protein